MRSDSNLLRDKGLSTSTPIFTPTTAKRSAVLACEPHDHSACIADALQRAQALCAAHGTRLTDLRAQVLSLIWESHKPLGAYTLMEMLAKASTRRVAPPTVYRALDFLLDEGLIHRINSLNAFIGCPSADKKHANHFLICENCQVALELDNEKLNYLLAESASAAGFTLRTNSVELLGLCPQCQTAQDQASQEATPK